MKQYLLAVACVAAGVLGAARAEADEPDRGLAAAVAETLGAAVSPPVDGEAERRGQRPDGESDGDFEAMAEKLQAELVQAGGDE